MPQKGPGWHTCLRPAGTPTAGLVTESLNEPPALHCLLHNSYYNVYAQDR